MFAEDLKQSSFRSRRAAGSQTVTPATVLSLPVEREKKYVSILVCNHDESSLNIKIKAIKTTETQCKYLIRKKYTDDPVGELSR